MKTVRQLHLYLGTFFAPAILFFAFTGALQTFGWHENEGGATHPAWIAKLAQIHKEQAFHDESERRGPPPQARKPENSAPEPEKPERAEKSPLPLKIFVFLMSLGLIFTTCLGLYLAFKYNRDRRVTWGLLVSGTLLPLFLLYFL